MIIFVAAHIIRHKEKKNESSRYCAVGIITELCGIIKDSKKNETVKIMKHILRKVFKNDVKLFPISLPNKRKIKKQHYTNYKLYSIHNPILYKYFLFHDE